MSQIKKMIGFRLDLCWFSPIKQVSGAKKRGRRDSICVHLYLRPDFTDLGWKNIVKLWSNPLKINGSHSQWDSPLFLQGLGREINSLGRPIVYAGPSSDNRAPKWANLNPQALGEQWGVSVASPRNMTTPHNWFGYPQADRILGSMELDIGPIILLDMKYI